MTREEIEQQLRLDNPTTTDDAGNRYGPGTNVYEAAIQRWADEIETANSHVNPIVVSMRSFREACGRDLTIRISAYVASIEDLNERFKAQTDFEFATTVSRAHFRVSQIASALGKTESEIDEVFALAQQLDLN
jgi:hypothetical protein